MAGKRKPIVTTPLSTLSKEPPVGAPTEQAKDQLPEVKATDSQVGEGGAGDVGNTTIVDEKKDTPTEQAKDQLPEVKATDSQVGEEQDQATDSVEPIAPEWPKKLRVNNNTPSPLAFPAIRLELSSHSSGNGTFKDQSELDRFMSDAKQLDELNGWVDGITVDDVKPVEDSAA